MTPFDCVDSTTTTFECDFGLAVIRLPNADVVVVRATCKELACWVPLNLLNVFLVTLPSLDWALRLLDAPQVDVLALASDSYVFVILPFYF